MINTEKKILKGFDNFLDQMLSTNELLGHSNLQERNEQLNAFKNLNEKSKLTLIKILEKKYSN